MTAHLKWNMLCDNFAPVCVLEGNYWRGQICFLSTLWEAKFFHSPPAPDSFCLMCFHFCLHSFLLTLCSPALFYPSTTVLICASHGAALAPVPSSPHSWQVTSWSIGHTRLAASTQMCPRLSFSVLHSVKWTSTVYLMLPCGLLPLLSSKSSAVILHHLLTSLLMIPFSFFCFLFAITFDLHWLTWKSYCNVSFPGFVSILLLYQSF